jgi:hypothetical protein
MPVLPKRFFPFGCLAADFAAIAGYILPSKLPRTDTGSSFTNNMAVASQLNF